MSKSKFTDIGASISLRRSVSAKALAAGAGDATETDGATVDRYINASNGAAGMFQSATFFLQCQATLATTETCKFKATLQDSADASSWADVAAAVQMAAASDGARAADALVITLTDPGGGSTQVGLYQCDFNLESLRRYIRAQVHQDLSAGATDTSFYCAGFAMGGATQLPVT